MPGRYGRGSLPPWRKCVVFVQLLRVVIEATAGGAVSGGASLARKTASPAEQIKQLRESVSIQSVHMEWTNFDHLQVTRVPYACVRSRACPTFAARRI